MVSDQEEETEPSIELVDLFKRYFVVIWTVGITFIVTMLLSPFIPPDISSLFLVAIMISAWRGGLGAGLLATILSVLIDIFIFIPAKTSFPLDTGDLVQLVVDVVAAILVGTLSASKRKSEDERKKLLLNERTARIEAEQANRIKDDFLAAVSHELRTPLTTIKTLTRILLKKYSKKDEPQDYLKDIASECDRQIDLINNLIDISRLKDGGIKMKLEKVKLIEVLSACEKVERIAAAARHHQIVIDNTAEEIFVRADQNALRRVVCSIMENSVKYTPPGGVIKLAGFENDKYGFIKVSDNGCGISETDLPHIFESFYRGHPLSETEADEETTGTGLGLYLAQTLTEAMDGEIGVESRLGAGSHFTICLPKWRDKGQLTMDNGQFI